MYTIRKGIYIDFAHHISGHPGACINIHGHTWLFEVALQAASLSGIGFVTDFKTLKSKVLSRVHDLLDHSLALGQDRYDEVGDELAVVGQALLATRTQPYLIPNDSEMGELQGARNVFPGGLKVVVFPFAPTAERLAEWLFAVAEEQLSDHRVRVLYAEVTETSLPVPSVARFERH